MRVGRPDYYSKLKTHELHRVPVDSLLGAMASHLTVEPVPEELKGPNEYGPKITDELWNLDLYVARGPKGWSGLVIGFPGSTDEFTTERVSTPYLRRILYPILDLRRRIKTHYGIRLRCLYMLGVRFPEVILKKLRLLELVVPHLVVLTPDLHERHEPRAPAGRRGEQGVQERLCHEMKKEGGLRVPVRDGHILLDFVAHELPTTEGTSGPERLDILGVDKEDKSLVAFEIKGPAAGRVELENLFLQGLAHRRWVEFNKMGIKFILDGPRGRRINTRKRVRLVLGFFDDHVPDLFREMRDEAMQRDRYLEIDFVHFTQPGGLAAPLRLSRIVKRADEPHRTHLGARPSPRPRDRGPGDHRAIGTGSDKDGSAAVGR